VIKGSLRNLQRERAEQGSMAVLGNRLDKTLDHGKIHVKQRDKGFTLATEVEGVVNRIRRGSMIYLLPQ
jgi:hypothetical protein